MYSMAFIIAGWALAGGAMLLHIVANLVLAAYPISSVHLTLGEDEDEDEAAAASSASQADDRLTTESALILRSIAALALAAAVAGAMAGLAAQEGSWWVLLLGPGIVLAVKVGISFVFARLVRSRLGGLRRVVRPLVRVLNRMERALRMERVVDSVALVPGSKHTYYLEVADLIKTSLRYLEAVKIPKNEKELRMIRSILRMDDLKVREIMCPRPDIEGVLAEMPLAAAVDAMKAGGHSKLPVYKKSLDNSRNVVGILFALDVLGLNGAAKGKGNGGLEGLVRPALFVSEYQTVEQLLQDFKEQRTSIALVVDEHGGVGGLVTITDIVEEIVGELEDEFDYDLPEVQAITDGEAIVDARVTIDQLNQALGTEVAQPDDADTVGGLVYRELARMPHKGDQVDVEPLRVTVKSMAGRRLKRLHVVRKARLRQDS